MTITNLKKFIRENFPNVIEITEMREYRGKRVAVDTSIFLNAYLKSAGEERWLDLFISLIVALLKHNIRAYFVFDGKPPESKRETREKRAEAASKRQNQIQDLELRLKAVRNIRADDLNGEDLDSEVAEGHGEMPKVSDQVVDANVRINALLGVKEDLSEAELTKKLKNLKMQSLSVSQNHCEILKKLFDYMGVTYLEADGEADPLCAHLCSEGVIDAVLSRDADMLAHGTPVLLDINIQDSSFERISLKSLLDALEMDMKTFIDFCIMCGTDYNSNIPGIGVVRAYKLISEHKTIENTNGLVCARVSVDISTIQYQRARDEFNHISGITIRGEKPDFDKILVRKKPDLVTLMEFMEECGVKTRISTVTACFRSRVKVLGVETEPNNVTVPEEPSEKNKKLMIKRVIKGHN
jgi:5'-3' exonuclease